MAKRKSAEVLAVKDEDEQRPIPTVWRPLFCEVVKAFIRNDFRLSAGVAGVKPISAKTAKQIEMYLEEYGGTLVELPERTWASSVCIWMGNEWDALVDLWTKEEGRSDLVLSARVKESKAGFVVQIEMVYVP